MIRRTITIGLLSICLGVFLCPAVGKTDVITWSIEKPSMDDEGCSAPETDACEAMVQDTEGCCGHSTQSSPSSHCCPAPCFLLVLMCNAGEHQRFPIFAARKIFPGDQISSARSDRPPVPPPRV